MTAHRLFRSFPVGAWRHAVLAAALGAATLLAWVTPVGEPPDELDHLDTVHYFQNHAWPPPLGADEVVYTAYGTSRAFNGEWSYWLLGRLSAAAASIVPAATEPFALRLWSVAALAALLAPLLYWPSALFRLDLVAVFLVTVPQLLYVCSYVNGDAWTIAAATWLLRVGLAIFERPEESLGVRFGVAVGLCLGTKPNAWVVVPFAFAAAVSGWRRAARTPWRRLALGALACLALLGPLRLSHPPWSQGGLNRSLAHVEARSRHARPEFDPRRPTAPGFMLRARGAGFDEVILNPDWWKRTAGSAYALFGPMTRVPPRSLLAGAALVWLLLLALQLERRAATGPFEDGRSAVVAGSSMVVAAMLLVAAWHSWNFDYQPQGRYLFPIFGPLGLLLCGIETERKRWRKGALLALALLALVIIVWLLVTTVGEPLSPAAVAVE
jgi:hypothetical protein